LFGHRHAYSGWHQAETIQENYMPVNLPRPALARLATATALVTVLATGLLGACGKAPAGGGFTTEATIEADKDAPPEVPSVWPLTGLPGEVVERPALAVKVENPKVARPQTGLEQADVVWEQMVEGGESRFIAVYNSQLPESVGPVRSIRPMDGPILGPTHGLLACSGGQSRFIDKAKDAGLEVLTEDSGHSGGFYRSTDRSMPHNLYLHPAGLVAEADDSHKALPAAEFTFADSAGSATAAKDGRAAASVAVTISGIAKPNWTWDESAKAYLRSEGETPSQSAAGVRLAAQNVIAVAVPIEMAGGADAAGNPIPESMIVGSGSGLVATGGKAMDVEWSKSSSGEPLILKLADGSEVTLAPGITWIELVPANEGRWVVS
jgi:hypothetical protein